MPRIVFIAPNGDENEIEVPAGVSVMSAATSNGVEGVVGECGGAAMCATCHVYVDEIWLKRLRQMSRAEDEMLEATASERRRCSRLSCQIAMTDQLSGLVVRTPERQT